MTDTETTTDESGGGFGCWGMVLIAALVVGIVVVSYLMLV
jgi:hypothetical protein